MKFSLLMDILNKADMVTEVAIQEDCEVADLNLMDRECQQMYNQTVYFIRAEEIGPTTKLPACLIYQGEVPEYREKNLLNWAKIREGVSLAEVFRYVKLQLSEAPELQAQYGDIVTKLISGVDLAPSSPMLPLTPATYLWPLMFLARSSSTRSPSMWMCLFG